MNSLLAPIYMNIQEILIVIKDNLYFLFIANKKDIILVGIIFFIFIVNAFITRFITKHIRYRVQKKIKSTDYIYFLMDHKFFITSSYIIPLLINYHLSSFLNINFIYNLVEKLTLILIVIVLTTSINKAIGAAIDFYKTRSISNNIPLTGIFQILEIIIIIIAGIYVISIIVNKSPWVLISGLGAITALILFIFRETFLSILASFQIHLDDTLDVGDWVVMGNGDSRVSGTVVDIALFVIKIKGWDNSMNYIPVKNFIEFTYKNYTEMKLCEARRIKKIISIDPNSIHNLSLEEINKLLLKKDEILERVINSTIASKMSHSNITVFREYLLEIFKRDIFINQNYPIFIRFSESDAIKGFALELYLYSKKVSGEEFFNHEMHLIEKTVEVMDLFNLKLYRTIDLLDKNSLIQ